MNKSDGELAIVLHTHMPYMEGFGTWPFGEEWLWEAIATSYLPLLPILDRAPITLSLTPVLCDQLEAPGATERCLRFLEEIRPESHRRDIASFREAREDQLADELERSAADYAQAAQRIRQLDAGLAGLFGGLPKWTSAATHAVLPLLLSDSGIELQVQTGIESHRRRFGEWAGGFWLPECAYAPWLDPLLEEAGVRATCVELTQDVRTGRPTASATARDRRGPSAVADRPRDDLARVERRGLSRRGRIPRLPRADHTPPPSARQRRVCSTTARARHALAKEHARDFIARVRARLADAGGGVCVCALDTELLGHWWFEGPQWLEAVVDEAARQELPLSTLDDALTRHADEINAAPADARRQQLG